MSRQQRLILLLVLLAACGLLWFASSKMHLVEKTVDDGFSSEARRNPYLAAEHFLRNQGIELTKPESPEKLLKQRDNLGKTWLYLAPRRHMSPRQAADLAAWVKHGGHLVVQAEQFCNKDKKTCGDLLLDPLGIQLTFARDDDDDDDEKEPKNNRKDDAIKADVEPAPTDVSTVSSTATISATAQQSDAGDHLETDDDTTLEQLAEDNKSPQEPFADLTKLYLENEEHPAYIDFQEWRVLTDSQNLAPAWASSADGIHLLQLPLGDGLLTVVSDADIWTNRQIGKLDNAWFLWYLSQDSQVWLTQDADWPSLFSLLLKHYPLTLLLTAMLSALLIWQHLLRSGPKRILAREQRRELREHLAASADFLRRQSGLRGLLRLLKQDVMQRASLHLPNLEHTAHAQQCQQLAQLTQLSAEDVRLALALPTEKQLRVRTFILQTQRLQRLRNRL